MLRASLDPDAAAQVLVLRLGGPVAARVVEACDPRDDCYRQMILVRVAPNCAEAMAALVLADAALLAEARS